MKRVFASTVVALFCAAGLAAQTPAADQKKAEPAKADEKSVTITGCLRAGETPNSFVLANVKDEAASKATAATPATPPTGTAGASSSMAAGEVKLIGAPASLDLAKHVGHTVAITGSWAPASKSSAATGTTGTAGAASSAASARSFNVKSMAHQSETCK